MVSLLLVGVVSNTLVRHIIQIAPIGIVLCAVLARAQWSPFAALALFVFWLAIMILIWLWLLGLASIVTGTFSAVEVVLTICIGLACLAGALAIVRNGRRDRWPVATAAFCVSFALQTAAMWWSLR